MSLNINPFFPSPSGLVSAFAAYDARDTSRLSRRDNHEDVVAVVHNAEKLFGTVLEYLENDEPVPGCKPIIESFDSLDECSAVSSQLREPSEFCAKLPEEGVSLVTQIYNNLDCFCKGFEAIQEKDAVTCVTAACSAEGVAAFDLAWTTARDIVIADCQKALPEIRKVLAKDFTVTLSLFDEIATHTAISISVPANTTEAETTTTTPAPNNTTTTGAETTTTSTTTTPIDDDDEPTGSTDSPKETKTPPPSAGERLTVKNSLVLGLSLVSFFALAL